jgi:hypothetical protein
MIMDIKSFSKDITKVIKTPLITEGGKVFVNRLVHLFGLRSKVELSELIGVSTGSIATWQTRNVVPYELAVRLHLATGVSVEYLLFDELKGDLNIMQYLPDPRLQPNYANIKVNLANFHYSLTTPANYDGGAVLIERLVSLFKVASKVELGDLVGVNIGTLGTWHTRRTTPHELLCRIHLATGVSMHYLCFGKEWEDRQHQQKVCPHSVRESSSADSLDNGLLSCKQTYSLDNGQLNSITKYVANDFFWSNIGIAPATDAVVISDNKSYFIDKSATSVSKGRYLFAVNDVYQIGELRQLPDGKTYFYDDGDKYAIDEDTTKIHGKVVSILESI